MNFCDCVEIVGQQRLCRSLFAQASKRHAAAFFCRQHSDTLASASQKPATLAHSVLPKCWRFAIRCGLFFRTSHRTRPVAMYALHINASVARRRAAIALLLAAAIFTLAVVVRHTRAAETQRIVVAPGRAQQVVSLRDRLIVGLQARLNSEVAFVELVVLQVRLGKLPQHVVDETFFWARDRASISRNGYSRRPIIFFQPAMIARAKRLRVEL
jgi:hypothetical protein